MTALDLAVKEAITLVEFTYGLSSASRYTDYTDEIVFNGQTYLSQPAIEVKWPVNKGTFEEAPCKIALPNDAFALAIASGIAFSPAYVVVRELTRDFIGPASSKVLIPFRGRVTRTFKNFQGRDDKILFEALAIKSRLNFPVSIPCNHHCAWTLFGRGCGLAGISNTGTITAINGKEVTIAGLAPQAGKYYQRGYVQRDGLRIPIHNWDTADPTKFYLSRFPPSTWLAALVGVVPGCDKTIETCRSRWANEANFGGIGYAIPAYHPVFEDH